MTQSINGVTATIAIDKGQIRKHLTTFTSLEDAISYMTKNDVISKGFNIGDDFYDVQIEKSDLAVNNWYENEMRISKHTPELPTNFWK